jgi:hypothetical protein
MGIFILVDAGGNVINLLSDDYGTLPPNAIQITPLIADVLRHGFAGYKYIGGELIAPAPTQLTPRQVRLVLNAAGLRANVEAAIAAADQNTKDMWSYSSVFLRSDPLLNSMATSLGLTSAQLDQLFIDGALL